MASEHHWSEQDTAAFWEQFRTYWPNVKAPDKLAKSWSRYLPRYTPAVALEALRELFEGQDRAQAPHLKPFRNAAARIEASASSSRVEHVGPCRVCHGVQSVPVELFTVPVGDVRLLEGGAELAKEFSFSCYDRSILRYRTERRMALELRAARKLPDARKVGGVLYCPACQASAVRSDLLAPIFDQVYRGKYAIRSGYEHLEPDLARLVAGVPEDRGPDLLPEELAAEDAFWDARFDRCTQEQDFKRLVRWREQMRAGLLPAELGGGA